MSVLLFFLIERCKIRLEQLGYLAELEKPGEENEVPEIPRTEPDTGTYRNRKHSARAV